MEIRLFKPEDAEETALVIEKTLRVSNSKDYSEQYIEFNVLRKIHEKTYV